MNIHMEYGEHKAQHGKYIRLEAQDETNHLYEGKAKRMEHGPEQCSVMVRYRRHGKLV